MPTPDRGPSQTRYQDDGCEGTRTISHRQFGCSSPASTASDRDVRRPSPDRDSSGPTNGSHRSHGPTAFSTVTTSLPAWAIFDNCDDKCIRCDAVLVAMSAYRSRLQLRPALSVNPVRK